MSSKFEKVRSAFRHLSCDGYPLLTVALDVTLYYEGAFQENAKGILDFYHRVLPMVGPNVTHFDVDGRRRPKKVKKDTLALLPFWCSKAAAERATYGLQLATGSHPEEVTDRVFELYHGPFGSPGFVQILLPLELIEQSVQPFLELALELPRRLKLLVGYGGFAVNVHPDMNTQLQRQPIYALSRRFKGVDFAKPPHRFAEYASSGTTNVNWLTFLGRRYTKRLDRGGRWRERLGKEITIHNVGSGIAIQAGPEPLFGDVKRRERLPHYQAVGRALRPVRLPEAELGIYNAIGGAENTRKWMARFDGA